MRDKLDLCVKRMRAYRERAHWAEQAGGMSPDLSPRELSSEEDSGNFGLSYSYKDWDERPPTRRALRYSQDEQDEFLPTESVSSEEEDEIQDFTSDRSNYLRSQTQVQLNMEGCQHCGKKADSSCSRCGQVAYCGRACQSQDWDNHHSLVCAHLELPPLIEQHYQSKGEVWPVGAFLDELQYGDQQLIADWKENLGKAWTKLKEGASSLAAKAKTAIQIRSLSGLRSIRDRVGRGGEWSNKPEKLMGAKKAINNYQLSGLFSRQARKKKSAAVLLLQDTLYDIGYSMGQLDLKSK